MPIAATNLGIQLALLVLLCAQLSTTVLMDRFDGRSLKSPQRVVGLILVVLATALSHIDHHHKRNVSVARYSKQGIEESSFMDVALASLVGTSYSLQAKCNNRLAQDVGHPARATIVSSAVHVAASVPVIGFLGKLGQLPVFIVGDWPRFVFAAFQSTFFVTTMMTVPRRLGYTASTLCVKCGALLLSGVLDALGALGEKIPFNRWRIISICLVGVGVRLLSAGTPSHEKGERNESEMLVPVARCCEDGWMSSTCLECHQVTLSCDSDDAQTLSL